MVYIVCVVALFAWEESRSSDVAKLVEHLFYIVPVCLCMTAGVAFGAIRQLQAKIEVLERRLEAAEARSSAASHPTPHL